MPDMVALAAAAVVVAALWLAMKAGRVAPAEAQRLVRAGADLVDVRSPAEFADGHLVGAVNVPLDQLGDPPEVFGSDRARPLVVYCRSGARSAMAARRLRKAGFRQVFDLGPMDAWPERARQSEPAEPQELH